MIDHLEGCVSAVGGTWAVLDLGGFGVRCLCSPGTAAGLRPGERARLVTSLVVREDSLTLYGFADERERDAFELVQTASGVGPKLAQAVISVLGPDELRAAVLQENVAALCKVPGIGRKGAQKMVIELKDRVNSLGLPDAAETGLPAATGEAWRDQVRDGLEGLGWSARDADAACERVAPLVLEDPEIPLATLMRTALQTLAR